MIYKLFDENNDTNLLVEVYSYKIHGLIKHDKIIKARQHESYKKVKYRISYHSRGDRYFPPLQAESGLILNRTNQVPVISTALFSLGPPQQG